MSYWNKIRGDREYPALTDIHAEDIREVWDYSFVLRVSSDTPDDCNFKYFGPALQRIFGDDFTGRSLKEVMNAEPKAASMLGFYKKALDRHSPVSEASEFYMESKELRYRSVMIPISSDGENIDHLIGTTNYKVFA